MAKKKEKSKNELRNVGIYHAAAAGKSRQAIADDFELSRVQVNRILNSDEAKRLTEVARSGLQSLMSDAVQTLADAMQDRIENPKEAMTAAIAVLKGTGVMSEKFAPLEVKPFIVKMRNGDEIHMGYGSEGEKGDE